MAVAEEANACVIGSSEDPHVAAVVEAAEALDAKVLVLDAATLESRPFIYDGASIALERHGALRRLGTSARGWVRRLAPGGWRAGVTAGTLDATVRSAWMSFIVSLTASRSVTWLSDIDRLFLAEHKLVQYRAARSLSIRVPGTAVVSTAELIPEQLGQRLVVKPLGPAEFTDSQGEARVVFATAISRTADALRSLSGAPFLVQQALDAKRHLRVVTVTDRAWVGELVADGVAFDWRRTEAAHDSFRPTDAYTELAAQAVHLAQSLGVGYSSQDWVVTDDGSYFLDLNPGGQWLFLPEPIASEVTAAIATWIAGHGDA